MRLLNTLAPVNAPNGCAVALGYFDGVHLGHRAVVDAAVRYAGTHNLTPAVFTFELPEHNALKGGRILSLTQKHVRLENLGIAECTEPPFASFCTLTPENFVEKILVGSFDARAVFCGNNFTFGVRAAGNVQLLSTLCRERGIVLKVLDLAQYQGASVSSTRIRTAMQDGRMEDVNAMLGAPYAIDWPVTHGQGLGHTLGVPTLNQNYPEGSLMPRSGVYLTRLCLADGWHPSATGISGRPTVAQEGAPVTCETYVPGIRQNLYGTAPTLEFWRYYEPIRRYPSLEGLKTCILDAAQASRAFFAKIAVQK
jgi:riboflavin kinase/FMN adenylyltransferase